MLLLSPLPIFALERFPFLSLPILYTCIRYFYLRSAVAACSNPIVYDLRLPAGTQLIPLSIHVLASVCR